MLWNSSSDSESSENELKKINRKMDEKWRKNVSGGVSEGDSIEDSTSEGEDSEGASATDSDEDEEDEEEDSEEMDDELLEKRVAKKVENVENDELLENIQKSLISDREKGKAIRKQLEVWDFLLDMRIKLQKPLQLANSLPSNQIYKDAIASLASDCERTAPHASCQDADNASSHEQKGLKDAQLITETNAMLVGLFDNLTEMQLKLIDDNVMSKQEKKKISKKRSFNDMDEWLDTTVNSVINPMDTVLEPYRVSVTQKWSEKVQAASGLAMQKKFKVINQSFSTLFSQLDHDKERLMKRTRLNRGNISIIGTPESSNPDHTAPIPDDTQSPTLTHNNRQSNANASIYNDDDFYHQILKEYIDAKVSRAPDANAPFLPLVRKNKKKVDTRASKGRKIRYHVHEKIMNFMAPDPVVQGGWEVERCKELFDSLFGGGACATNLSDVDQNLESRSSEKETRIDVASDGFRLF